MNSLPKDAPAPVSEIEFREVDLRFEGYRLRQPEGECCQEALSA